MPNLEQKASRRKITYTILPTRQRQPKPEPKEAEPAPQEEKPRLRTRGERQPMILQIDKPHRSGTGSPKEQVIKLDPTVTTRGQGTIGAAIGVQQPRAQRRQRSIRAGRR